jgi:hypothetical protein
MHPIKSEFIIGMAKRDRFIVIPESTSVLAEE